MDPILKSVLIGAAMPAGFLLMAGILFGLAVLWIDVTNWFRARRCPACGTRQDGEKYRRGLGRFCPRCVGNWSNGRRACVRGSAGPV